MKAAAVEHAALTHGEVVVEAGEPQEAEPTAANAGPAEVEAADATKLTNGHADAAHGAVRPPVNGDVDGGATNGAGESQWETPGQDMSMSISQEWVDVTADVPASQPPPTLTTMNSTQSWADEQPEPAAEVGPVGPTRPAIVVRMDAANSVPQTSTSTPAEPNDGFYQVHRNRPRGDRDGGERGGWRGRGGGRGSGEYRGRGGYRGDGSGYRGRGRGGPRGGGGGMAMRGGRPGGAQGASQRAEES